MVAAVWRSLCAENCVASKPACFSAFSTSLWTAVTLMRLPLREPNNARLSVRIFLLRSAIYASIAFRQGVPKYTNLSLLPLPITVKVSSLEILERFKTAYNEINEFKKGDIITFKQDNKVISHRIVQIINKKDSKVFITKGDNNKIEDDEFVNPDQIYGKVIFSIPKIGNIVEYIQKKEGFARGIIIAIIVFILICLRDDKKNKRKMIRKKYEIKKTPNILGRFFCLFLGFVNDKHYCLRVNYLHYFPQ